MIGALHNRHREGMIPRNLNNSSNLNCIGRDVLDGLSVDLQRCGAIELDCDLMHTVIESYHFFVLNMLALEDVRKHHQRL